jgi:hypothetical protein
VKALVPPLVFLLFLLPACTYAPEGDFFKDIKPVVKPNVTVSLNSYDDTSTIYVFAPTQFSYRISADGGNLEHIEVLLNGRVISSSQSGFGTFTIDYDQLISGTYELKIQFHTDSGSGSLAEKAGAERFQVWRTWELIMDVSAPPRPTPVLSEENGRLKISWDEYTNPNFVAYRIESWGNFGYNIIEIDDPHQTFIINEDYVGGYNIEYTVSTITHLHYMTSHPVRRIDTINLEGDYNASDSTVKLTWDKADFAGAFSSYTIIENGVEHPPITDVADTSLRFKPFDVIFGLSLSFGVRINSVQSYSPASYDYFLERPVESPKLDPLPEIFAANKTLNAVFGWSPWAQTLRQYNNELEEQKSIQIGSYSCTIPYEGLYIYYTDYQQGIVQLNIQTNELNYIDIIPMTSWGFFSDAQVTSASVNQVVTFKYTAYDDNGFYLKDNIVIYDMANKVELYHQEFPSGTAGAPMVSGNGKYIAFSDGKIYRIDGTALTFLYNLPGYAFIGFRPDNSEEILMSFHDTFYTYDAATGGLKRSFNSPGGYYMSLGYDPSIKSFVFAADYEKQVYGIDVDTGHKTTVKTYSSFAHQYKIVNGFLIAYDGHYFKAFAN